MLGRRVMRRRRVGRSGYESCVSGHLDSAYHQTRGCRCRCIHQSSPSYSATAGVEVTAARGKVKGSGAPSFSRGPGFGKKGDERSPRADALPYLGMMLLGWDFSQCNAAVVLKPTRVNGRGGRSEDSRPSAQAGRGSDGLGAGQGVARA